MITMGLRYENNFLIPRITFWTHLGFLCQKAQNTTTEDMDNDDLKDDVDL